MSSYKAQNPEISAEPTYRKPVNRSATPERLDKALEKFPQGDSLEGELKQAAARREESAQSHRIAAPYINPTPNPKYPLAAYQNPTNNPTVALLLERYGDMRGIFTKHPLFLKMVKPEEEGGWGVGLGGLINLGKQYGLERVLRAAKEAREYVGATSRGAVFNHAVRNGLEAGK